MPVIWQLSIIQFYEKTLVSGVILQKPPSLYSHKVSRLKNLVKVAKSYLTPVASHLKIEIRFDDQVYQTKTTARGSFSLLLENHHRKNPEIRMASGGELLKLVQDYPVFMDQTQGQFDVISDIDDTILRSYSSDALRRIKTLALTSPYKRKVIGYTRSLFERFNTQSARVFYVSKSESNLFNLLTSYIRFNGFPEGTLFLTSYLNFFTLFRPNKGRDYKINHIRFIIRNSGNKKFYLLGDDGQRDMEIYLSVAKEFPDRIANVFIRQTRSKRNKKQVQMWEQLKQKVPAAVYYRDGDESKSSFEELVDFTTNP